MRLVVFYFRRIYALIARVWEHDPWTYCGGNSGKTTPIPRAPIPPPLKFNDRTPAVTAGLYPKG